MERDVFRGGCFFAAASLEFDGRPGPGARPGRVDDGRVAAGARGRDPGRAGRRRARPGPRQRAARVRDQRARAWAPTGPSSFTGDDAAFERARAAIRRAVSEKQRLPVLPIDVDEGAARRTLRDQIAKLERELASLFVSAHPRGELDWQVSSPGGPRRARRRRPRGAARRAGRARRGDPPRAARARRRPSRQAAARIEALVADPGSHKWERVSNDDIGEPGCKYYHSTPRLGLVGMLMGWWRVKISSGCP